MNRVGTRGGGTQPVAAPPFPNAAPQKAATAPNGSAGGMPRGSWGAYGRRRAPRVLAGLALVVGCALVFGLVAARGQHGEHVLALARAVPAGQALSAEDLTTVEITGDQGASTVAASELSQWVGRTLTTPLPAGQIVTPANLGASRWPPPGQSVVAVSVDPGRLPAGVVAGSSVRIVVSPATSTTGTNLSGQPGVASAVSATVVQVSSSDSAATLTGTSRAGSNAAGAGAMLSLLVRSSDAVVVAAAPTDRVAVVLQQGS